MRQPSETADSSQEKLTSHAILVAWGLYAQEIGLVENLMQVPISQRSREHTPQTKVLEFLVSVLAGCAYLQDISCGAHPLDKDQVVAEAWGQPGWADYSGVSRTLQRCDDATVSAIKAALADVSRPFIAREVQQVIESGCALIYDGDLTGRPVSQRSTTYPGAAYGWMDDGVSFGYQAALVSMHSPTYGRLWLSVTHHPGDVVSTSQAAAMIQAAEASTGVRPWRRTEFLEQRMAELTSQYETAEGQWIRAQQRFDESTSLVTETEQERRRMSGQVKQLVAHYGARQRPERPYSQLAKARRKLTTLTKRRQRRKQALVQREQRLAHCQAKVERLHEQREHLQQRLQQLHRDNETNLTPVRAIFRLDGGFGSGDNLALLIEMGYMVYTKATNAMQLQAFRRRITPSTPWTRVGKNAQMVQWREQTIGACPYPLDVALERFYTGDTVQHGLLVHFGDDLEAPDVDAALSTSGPDIDADTDTDTDASLLPAWFHFYNQRQTIEAGIKEGKQVFQMHHLKVRSLAGLVIQELFATFAANFVRWAAAWLHEACMDVPAPLSAPQPNVKHLVRIAANTSAWVSWHSAGCLLRFTTLSTFAGLQLVIQRSLSANHRRPVSFQLALPFFESVDFSPI
jgi:hypothetical protein